MVYSDIIFLLGLLPCSLLFSFFDRSTEYKNLILVLTSVIFFAWAKPSIVLLLFATVILEYSFAVWIDKVKKNNKSAKMILVIDAVINSLILIIFGNNFLFEKINFLSFPTILLPIGVGYYTIKGFSYCYDVYVGNCKCERNIFCLLTYMVSYHFLLVGPVVRYGDIEPYIRKRTVTADDYLAGFNKIIIGLAKIVMLSPVFTRIKLAGLADLDLTVFGCWLGMLAFFAEAYFVFSGMCDMSQGLGKLNGFDYPKNYRDFKTTGLFTGVLKTYNTTLIEFFDEIFSNIGKNKRTISFLMTILCSVIIALWYQIRINFLIVGLVVGIFVALEKYAYGKKFEKSPAAIKFIYNFMLTLVIFGGIYFADFTEYKSWLTGLFGVGSKFSMSSTMTKALLNNMFLIIIALISMLSFVKEPIMTAVNNYAEKSDENYGKVRVTKLVLSLLLFVICVITIAAQLVAV